MNTSSIVDDDPFTVELLTEALDEQGFLPQSAPDGKGAREALNRREFRVAIFDLSLPDLEGMELVREVNQSSPDTAIIILTGYPTLESSIEALRQGAFDYLIKPFKAPEVIATIQKALNDHSLKAELAVLRSRVRELEQELRRYQEGAPMPPPGRPAGPSAPPCRRWIRRLSSGPQDRMMPKPTKRNPRPESDFPASLLSLCEDICACQDELRRGASEIRPYLTNGSDAHRLSPVLKKQEESASRLQKLVGTLRTAIDEAEIDPRRRSELREAIESLKNRLGDLAGETEADYALLSRKGMRIPGLGGRPIPPRAFKS